MTWAPGKGRYFTSWSTIRKGREIVDFGSWKGWKGPIDAFYGYRKVEKTFRVCDLLKFKRLNLQRLKEMQRSKLGMWKGYHLSIKGIRKGYRFCAKWYIKGSGVGSQGGAFAYRTLLSSFGPISLPPDWQFDKGFFNRQTHGSYSNPGTQRGPQIKDFGAGS